MNTAGTLLMERNSDFLGFCAQWERDKAPFLGTADWFYDMGMNGQAAGWRWAAERKYGTCPEATHYRRVGRRKKIPVEYMWRRFRFLSVPMEALADEVRKSALPEQLFYRNDHFGMSGGGNLSPTFPESIAWFLDTWASVFGDNHDPDLDIYKTTGIDWSSEDPKMSWTARFAFTPGPQFQPSRMGIIHGTTE